MRILETRVPPLLATALAGAAMAGAAALWPHAAADWPLRPAAAALLAASGVAVALLGVAAFVRAGTTVNPLDPEKVAALVQTGVFGVSRNPMYLGMALVLAGLAAWLSHPAAWALLVLFVVWIDRFQIAPEERVLAARFGAAFDAYRRRVRRWL